MADLTNPKVIYAKGFLFLLGGLLASALLLLEQPTVKIACLLAVAVWCFARFYYFAFYVIERYVDPDYRFSGLWSFACYLLRGRPRPADPEPPSQSQHFAEEGEPTRQDSSPP